MDIEQVGVVGCGTMGSGICEVFARAGYPVVFSEVDEQAVEDGLTRIRTSLDRAVAGEKLDAAERDEVLARIRGEVGVGDFGGCQLVVEAVPEDPDLKARVHAELDEVLAREAIVATNTSSLPIIDLAVAGERPERLIGFHFFNPAPVMRLIELVTTVVTAPEVVEQAQQLAEGLGKTPVVCRDRAGFIANLLLFPYLNQAVGMLEASYASREDIDAAMRLGAGHPMGPLALLDLIGLDTAVGILSQMYAEFGDARYHPNPMLRELVAAGHTGRKAGRGFYAYEEPGSPKVVAEVPGERPPSAPVDAISGWRRIGVVGTGTMASGIAEVLARAGYEVVVRGRTDAKAEGVVEAAGKSLQRQVDKGRMEADEREATMGRMEPTSSLEALAGCQMVIEAVVEELDVKRELFADLDRVVGEDAVLATTTSSLPVVDCAMATSRPEKVVGVHFFNPAQVMRLVEIVPTVRTAAEVVEQARALCEAVGKHPVQCADRAGFIVNALLFPYLNDAVRMLAEGYATATDIDTAMKLGCAHPMGPFQLADIVGLDVTHEILRALHREFRAPAMQPAPLLGHMVEAGFLGRKTRKGFHIYG